MKEKSPRTPNSSKTKKPTWQDLWFKDKFLKHVVFKMQLDSLSTTKPHKKSSSSTSPSPKYSFNHVKVHQEEDHGESCSGTDFTSLLSDELLLQVFSFLPSSCQNPNSVVCKRWMFLLGRMVRSVNLLDWNFLESGRLISRFPNLVEVNLVRACIDSPRNSGIVLTHRLISINLDSDLTSGGRFISEDTLLPVESIDRGLTILARGCPNLRRLVLISATERGLSSVAQECATLQELELHDCTDLSLKGISACKNLQILKLIGSVEGFYNSVISDIGLTILAHGCKRLVKLELSGCEVSYDGIRAVGQCLDMLEELTFSDHRMDGGWLAGIPFCANLKTLKLLSCKKIDPNPGPVEHLGTCRTLETLHLQRCQLRDKQSMKALFLVCASVREIIFHDCWGLDNEMLAMASLCRRVKILHLEGCSRLTTEGLESVVLSWPEFQRLRVVSCSSIKDNEVTSALSSLFSVLKELKWRPDTRSLLSSSLAGVGVGKKGGRFFKRRNTIKGIQTS